MRGTESQTCKWMSFILVNEDDVYFERDRQPYVQVDKVMVNNGKCLVYSRVPINRIYVLYRKHNKMKSENKYWAQYIVKMVNDQMGVTE